MATKFSPCKGSYVLNQFPSNVMFGMNGFHLSASGAIQGHHGPLVSFPTVFGKGLTIMGKKENDAIQPLLILCLFKDPSLSFRPQPIYLTLSRTTDFRLFHFERVC